MSDDDVNEVDQLLPTVPIRETQESIHPEEEAQGPIFVLGPESGQRIDGIRRPLSLELSRVD